MKSNFGEDWLFGVMDTKPDYLKMIGAFESQNNYPDL